VKRKVVETAFATDIDRMYTGSVANV
jgi:hypothetical protein